MIGELLDVRVVCLSEIQEDKLHFLSVYNQGEVFLDAGQCSLAATPCATVEATKDFRTYEDVATKFPEAKFLKDHDAYSYCGFPAMDSDGKVAAVICLLDDRPHVFTEEDKDLLQIFSQRISFEIERKKNLAERKATDEEKAKLEEHLRQSQKMEAIGTMAGGIAHDFNNLLAIIRGNIDIIQHKQKNGNPFDKNLESIDQSTSRAIDLVKQILTFSRQEKTLFAPVDMAIAIKGSLRLLRSTIPSTVEIVSSVNEPVLVNADTTQLQQILINLCTNAVHAMEGKGLLTFTLHEVELSAHEIPTSTNRQAGRYAKLTITDTGTGMDKETLARIFEPFFTTKGAVEGTGMGLSVVYGLVDSHGGFIAVDSILGQGTSFNIYFPTIDDRRQRSEVSTVQELPFGTERILFVDDEKDLSSTCTELLEYQGYKVTSSTSSVEALAIFKGNPETFDLVFTDQAMPEMAGTELAAELLKIRPNIPIILCSGFGTTTSENDAKSIGIRKYCTKPLNESQLVQIVRNVLDDGSLS
jgi:signal transduction histidine kinase/CheY-like chemotaxis protein